MKILIAAFLILLSVSSCLASDTLIPSVTGNINKDGSGSVTVSGTATDTTNDDNITWGIARVELKLDSNNWVTASGTTSYTYQFTGLDYGNHVIAVRSIDYSLNPSDVLYLDVYLSTSEASGTDEDDEDDDLSWYIKIDDLVFLTLNMEETYSISDGSDVGISFDIDNDYSEDRKLRYTISKGLYELSDNIIVDSGDSESIDEWISGTYLSLGDNRFNIVVEDYETQDTVVEKSIILSVVESTDPGVSSSDSSEVPEWFVAVAEANDLTISSETTDADVQELQTAVTDLQNDITDLGLALADLTKAIEDDDTETEEVVRKVSDDEDEDEDDEEETDYVKKYWMHAGVLGIAVWKRKKIPVLRDYFDDDEEYYPDEQVPRGPPAAVPPERIDEQTVQQDYRG